MKSIRIFISFFLWDIAFYLMISIMIIANSYAHDRMNETVYTGLLVLLWFLVGAFIALLFSLKKSATGKNGRLIEFIVICIPALYFITLNYNIPFVPKLQFFTSNLEVFRNIGALVLGCEVFGLVMKRKI